MKYHGMAFLIGFGLDFLFGDPHIMPHPIRLIGNFIKWLERKLRRETTDRAITEKEMYRRGVLLAVIVPAATAVVSAGILFGAYKLHQYAGVAAEAVMTYWILAARSLKTESMKVYRCLKIQDLPAARRAVSMIVGRDTDKLEEEGVAKAAVETVAENTSDGVIAPMLYTALGGPVLGFFYKAVNTMDSMVGYKNDTYLYFGRAAAKLDDAVNYLPARISAAFMLAAAYLCQAASFGKKTEGVLLFSGKRAFAIYKKDRKKHASPNSAQTESVCAGALGIRLAGEASYFGTTVSKPYIGEAERSICYEDIRYANRLMYTAAFLCEGFCLLCIRLFA